VLPLSKFCSHHFTFHGDICYFPYIVSHSENYTCISLFELNIISIVNVWNEEYVPQVVLHINKVIKTTLPGKAP